MNSYCNLALEHWKRAPILLTRTMFCVRATVCTLTLECNHAMKRALSFSVLHLITQCFAPNNAVFCI